MTLKRIARWPVISAILFLLMPLAIWAGDRSQRTFNNNDLSKYGGSSGEAQQTRSVDSARPGNYPGSSNTGNNGYSERKRYIIPYYGPARRIIIPVTFNGRVTAPMLLDTGAPGMHMSTALAEKIGIMDSDSAKLQVLTGGIGGTTPAIFTIVDSIQVGKMESNFIPTRISNINFRGFEGLLGMDFMANYSIQIDTRRRVVIFEELPESVHMPAGHDESWWRVNFHNFKSMKKAWGSYREQIAKYQINSDRRRKIQDFIESQYRSADELYNRLAVYASEHSVPLEWR